MNWKLLIDSEGYSFHDLMNGHLQIAYTPMAGQRQKDYNYLLESAMRMATELGMAIQDDRGVMR